MKKRSVIVFGAGPAGLTATYDLARRGIPVRCLEADRQVGGISRTIEYKGFRFDIGGHRFYSKYERVNRLWQEVLGSEFLVRPRLSRIYYNGRFFHYPLQPVNALKGLGLARSLRIVASYVQARIVPVAEEKSFEDWVSNRFGRELYSLFFKTYTEKVWGIPCHEIQAEWAAQRIRGLSLFSAVVDALFGRFRKQKTIKTLINEFHYPKYGPGQMYETMALQAKKAGAAISMRHRMTEVMHANGRVTGVKVKSEAGEEELQATDFISSVPITELILSLRPEPPAEVVRAARSLRYRSLVTVNLLLAIPQQLPDTWIYVHDPTVALGRIQCFANWSPFMVPSRQQSSLGLEYFCSEGDALWSMADDRLLELGIREATRIGILDTSTVKDGFVVRMPKCYPLYERGYQEHLATIRRYLEQFGNLQLSGRYGLFKYNNMDHSILTALLSVENILGARHDVWAINADDEYNEEQKG